MYNNHFTGPLVLLTILSMISCSQESSAPAETKTVRISAEEAHQDAAALKEQTTLELADGIDLQLWATDSLAPDPITLSINDYGHVFLTRTNRQKNSEFDIRGYQHWMTPSISFQSVEDRRAFLRETFAPEKSDENKWFPDLNNDGSHDWHDLKVEQDEIWRVEDSNGDGMADVSTRVIRDFHEEITDVAGALLVRKDDIFVGIGPDMWRFEDLDEQGIPQKKTSISHGYAIHIGFGAHGMSGAIEGPDGKIYWGIGDIGANIVDQDGTHHMYPNQGVIVRSNPDGSDFEVFAHGLRNTHEFVFDKYGNIISSDNDGDHPGESERLVHIVEGSDAGWRSNWQYGKYTDPRNNDYKVWMDEELFKPRWEGQAAYIIPPIMNYHNGPTGMAYNPGTALGSDWLNTFFLVEFVGNPSRSPLWSFTLKPSGASFDLEAEQKVITGILPTGIRFGPDGALYVADWVNGWGTKDYGRIWRMDVTSDKNDLADKRKETEILMKLDYTSQKNDELAKLLSHDDMRIRQKAQFELAKRGEDGLTVFDDMITNDNNQMSRIHSIWGIGQLAADHAENAQILESLLDDSDPEIIAQACKVIGDVRYQGAADALIPLLDHAYPRVAFFSAQALGRLAYEPATDPLIEFLETNNDEDIYLRHAGVLALARIGKAEPMLALEDHPSKALRTAAVLVLRKLGDPRISAFLDDSDEYIIAEAARAINDDWSIEPALPDLAALMANTAVQSEVILRRSINAALRVGGETQMDLLLDFISRKDVSDELRAEAIATLATWSEPSVLDRVDGRYRGEISRDPQLLTEKVRPLVSNYLSDKSADILTAVTKMLAELDIKEHNAALEALMLSHENTDVRSEALLALLSLATDQSEETLTLGMNDADADVRATALSKLGEIVISKDQLPEIANPVFAQGSVREQQELLGVIRDMPVEKTEALLTTLIDRMAAGELSPSLMLDLKEAVDSTHSETLINEAGKLTSGESLFDQYKVALYGGDRRDGWVYFNRNPTGQCTRCHSLGDDEATVGPNLRNIGNTLSREQLLEALIEPSKRIAPGYGTVSLTLTDESVVTGILIEEHENELILKTNEAEPLEIPINRISKRENLPSSMPPVTHFMSKREMRDVVEFLANLKEEES